MVVLLCGGSYVLSNFTATQFEQRDKRVKRTTQRKFDIEEEHKAMMDKLSIDDYSLSRIPRKDEPETIKKRDERREAKAKARAQGKAAQSKAWCIDKFIVE